jgi:hypothetical protein
MQRSCHSRNGRVSSQFAAFAAVALSFAGCAVGASEAQHPYSPLAPLIGDWAVGPDGAAPAFVERFSWGPEKSYIWVKVALLRPPGDEHLHFEGIVIWNAATRRFDYLFAVEPGSQTQEQGEFWLDGDGNIVRDVVLTAANGKTARFKQTFRPLGADRIETSLLRETADGWTSTFPGSDRLLMTRSGSST